MQIEIFNDLKSVPREKWNQILERQFQLYSYEFCQVLEQSRINDFDYLYLLVSDDAGRPLGLACSYTITTDLAIFSPRWLKRILDKVRTISRIPQGPYAGMWHPNNPGSPHCANGQAGFAGVGSNNRRHAPPRWKRSPGVAGCFS